MLKRRKKTHTPQRRSRGPRRTHSHTALTKGYNKGHEPRAVILARNSAATPGARTKNKRVSYSSKSFLYHPSTFKKKKEKEGPCGCHVPRRRHAAADRSSSRRFHGGVCVDSENCRTSGLLKSRIWWTPICSNWTCHGVHPIPDLRSVKYPTWTSLCPSNSRCGPFWCP